MLLLGFFYHLFIAVSDSFQSFLFVSVDSPIHAFDEFPQNDDQANTHTNIYQDHIKSHDISKYRICLIIDRCNFDELHSKEQEEDKNSFGEGLQYGKPDFKFVIEDVLRDEVERVYAEDDLTKDQKHKLQAIVRAFFEKIMHHCLEHIAKT